MGGIKLECNFIDTYDVKKSIEFINVLVNMDDWGNKRCSFIWKQKNSKSNRTYYQLQPKKHIKFSMGQNYSSVMFPTPSAYDWNTAQKQDKYEKRKEYQKNKGVNLHYPLKQMVMDINPSGSTSQLSPFFIMEMMGFPKNWTLNPFTYEKK